MLVDVSSLKDILNWVVSAKSLHVLHISKPPHVFCINFFFSIKFNILFLFILSITFLDSISWQQDNISPSLDIKCKSLNILHFLNFLVPVFSHPGYK